MKDIKEIEVNEHEEISNHKNQNKMSETVTKKEMSIEELELMLEKKKAAQQKRLEKERVAYITERDKNIQELIEDAYALNVAIKTFKGRVAHTMQLQSDKLADYGKIRKNSKGGFSITNEAGDKRIVRRRDTEPTWDERGDKGVAMLKDFLGDVVKKRDLELYEILMGFLERNEKGDLEYSRVMDLLKHENKWNDKRWSEGLRLVKESYSNTMKGYGYQFMLRPEEGDKWESINLNFSSI